jgi:cell division protein FtsB
MVFGKKTQSRGKIAGQRRRKGRLNRKLLPALGILALAGLFLFGQLEESDVAAWLSLRSDQEELSAEVDALEKENAAIEAQIEELASNPDALEKLAREQHNMRRPDEEVLTVIDQEPSDAGSDR